MCFLVRVVGQISNLYQTSLLLAKEKHLLYYYLDLYFNNFFFNDFTFCFSFWIFTVNRKEDFLSAPDRTPKFGPSGNRKPRRIGYIKVNESFLITSSKHLIKS